jgi:hypothetical protein
MIKNKHREDINSGHYKQEIGPIDLPKVYNAPAEHKDIMA